MLDQLITESLRHFQSDCLNFSEKNYPTVHNRGIKEAHLGKAFARRVINAFAKHNTNTSLTEYEGVDALSPPFFCIESTQYHILIVVHRLLSANQASRKGLINNINKILNNIEIKKEKETRLIILADHWTDRSNASKSIPCWWLGHQPIHQMEYAAQGIKLIDAKHSFSQDISHECQLEGGRHRIYHPLHRYKDGLPFFKYMLLAATYPL